MTLPTPEQRIAFASGLAHLLLKYAKLTRKDKAYVESVRDAKTPEAMEACWRTYTSASALASASVSAYASVRACRYASVYVYAYASAYACRHAVKAGVPEEQVDALHALTLGLDE